MTNPHTKMNINKALCPHYVLPWLLACALGAASGAAPEAEAQDVLASAPPPLAVLAANASRCRVSEFTCANNKCIPINRFCDAANDCGDASDEPRHCSRCNRTYYGDIGRTYELELHRPREDRLPYVCLLTLTAAGGVHGDLVQVTLDSFTLGRFVSFTVDGCPDGYLQIAESGRPQVGGSWCGTSWGPAIYYSETQSITLVVRLLRLSKDQNNYNFDFRMEYKVLKKDLSSVRYGGVFPVVTNKPSHIDRSYAGNVSRGAAPDTLPPPAQSREYYLGDLISGTYCSRIFSDCDRKLCRLQSPNFPGVYPRNLTCYYAVRQHEVPAGKHALVRVRQSNGQLVSIRSQAALYAPAAQQQRAGSRRELKVWAECDEVQDYVTIYDGYTTRDPVVLKFCGGGEPVPAAVSSGPELLVEFTTSPFGTFLHPTPLQALHGFQLEVEVVFVDQQSPTYAKNKRACEFWIRGTGSGVLEHPQHSLPPNTTCLYHMQGIDTSISVSPGPIRSMSYPWRRPGFPYPSPRFRVWFSVLKFHVTNSLNPNLPEEEFCASHLNIWDGPMRISPGCSDIFCDADKWKVVSRATGPQSVAVGRPPSNATLVARYCRERAPRTCEHALLAATRPCARAESFLSRGDSLTLELKVTHSTAIKPVSFKALYEFVDLHQDGQPHGAGPCSRRFRAPPEDTAPLARRFTAPRDVFLYGRGGATNLSCQYRFEAKRGERVKLTISRLWTGGQACATRESAQTARLRCHGRAAAALRVAERPWGDAPRPSLPRDCLCDDKLLPFTYVSTSRLLELHFTVLAMNSTDDFRRFFFEASFEFIRTPVCERPRRLSGPSGQIDFQSPNQVPDEMNCEHHPWLIDPSPGRYLYVQVRGTLMKEPNLDHKHTPNNISVMAEPRYNCLTRNRIAVYAGGLVPVVICPQPPHEMRNQVVEVFSDGWGVSNKLDQHLVLPVPKLDEFNLDKPRAVVVEYIGREMGSYSITWLELMKMKPSRFTAVFAMSEICKYKCPELDACINASLWCDGVEHCPSGQDESLAHCSAILQLPAQYLALIFALIICIACLTVLAALKVFKRRRTSVLQQRLKSLSSDTGMFDEKEVIC